MRSVNFAFRVSRLCPNCSFLLIHVLNSSPVRIRTLSELDTLSTRREEQRDEWEVRKKSVPNVVFKEKRTRARRPRYFALLALYPSEGFSYCKNKTSAHAAVGEVRALIEIVPSGHKFNIRPIDELCSSP